MERAGRALANASSALDAQITRNKAQEEAAELKHAMNFVMAIARAAPLAPPLETDRLATASEGFLSVLERAAFVAGDLKKVFASIHLYSPLFSATLRLLSAAVPLATAPGSHVERSAISTIQAQLIPDPRTLYWWAQMAGPLALHVNWETFVLAFHRSLEPPQPLSAADTAILRYILDPFESGSVAAWRYGDLARALGAPTVIMTRMRELSSLRAFIGYASSTEADRLLAFEPSATLLVRISKGKPNQWALASKDGYGRIIHTVVTLTPGEMRVADKTYGTFVSLITDLRLGQGQPPLPREPSFYGELLAARADDMLAGKPLGTYIWRFSSRTSFLALSFVFKENGAAQHISVEQTAATTFKLEEHTQLYTNLAEIVAALAANYKLAAPLLRPVWFSYVAEPEAAAVLTVSRSAVLPTSPGRRGPVQLGNARTTTGSSVELVPPEARARGPSPAPSPSNAAPSALENPRGARSERSAEKAGSTRIEKTSSQGGSQPPAPLLASRPALHSRVDEKEGYDFMPLGAPQPLGGAVSSDAPKGPDFAMAQSVMFEPLPLNVSEKHVPALAIYEPADSPKAALESPSARPPRSAGRKTGDYAFMPSRSDSNPVPPQQQQQLNVSLAHPSNPLNQPSAVTNPLRSPGRRPPQDSSEYDFMPNP